MTWGLGVGLGWGQPNPLGFGGWDKGTWGLGVGLGWGQPLWDWGTTLLVLGAGTRGLGV